MAAAKHPSAPGNNDTKQETTPASLSAPLRQMLRLLVCFALAAAMLPFTQSAYAASITVTTTARYQPQFLNSLGFGPLTVTGNATGRLVRAQDGTER